MMRLFCLLSVCYLWFCGFGGKQEGKVSDSALYVLKDKAYGHISKGEYQETERVCQEILQNTVWGGQEWFYTYALIYQGQARIMLGKTQEGLQDLLGAKRLAEIQHNDSALCSVYNGLGLYEQNVTCDYYRSLNYYREGCDIAERCGHRLLYCLLVANIAEVLTLRNEEAGLEYAEKCYLLGRQNNDPYLIYCGAISMARNLCLNRKMEEAWRYTREADRLSKRYDFKNRSDIYNTYGEIALEAGDYMKAGLYYEQAIREHGFSQAAYVVSTYVGYGRALIAQKKYKSALEKLQIGKEISEKNITSLFRREVYLLLSACYDRLGEPKEALEYYKKYTAESFRLYNEDKERTEKELMVRYETEKRNKELAQKNMLLQKEQNRVMALVGITFVVLIVVLLFYINYRRKNRLYKQIVRESVDWLAKERQFSKRIAEQEKQLQELIGKAGAVDGGRYSGSSLNKDSQQELFGRLERLMQNDQVYKNSLFTREKMAELLGTNRTYLSQTINEQTGLTFTHYMNKYRIEEARRILADPQDDTPIKAIAADLGFSSVTTFYTLFKAAVQMSPDQYRKHARSLRENKS
ncbi:helix-turn-helix domain-containing protein [Odoribacter splanchnicus]|uniref:Transcriptional regulator, AraC family n=3 Tax=Odoribacter splanchnicus TaxID=28118 RepID=F9ZBV2_ODOSD|nr:helix-turn-helix domain-containing protein [Odoribacter splanchnicus]ADY34481.1 transcriptional regulator, AraC family [Odoribacter splanchnicus DSM 20712]MBV4275197.1 helix-turn-helix domain-containing protein [Odoribacter splanchnicus]MBV4291013.1 helix-turn-helix domain-containing protein [Odoribacter splanchnicus]UEB87840.1 helix-turn-helix domain-containing protein [Odoribacter splanchnicus DSM 20712]SNV46310.1 transcriptional regulator [Odoribacter splanchnicus]